MAVYSHCPSCGLDFPSRVLALDNVTNATLSSITENCPRCGARATGMSGRFNFHGDHIEVIEATPETHAMLLRLSKRQVHHLRTTVAWAQQRSKAPEHDIERTARTLEKAIEDNAPVVISTGWLEKIRAEFTGNMSGWVAVLIAVITLIVMLGQQDQGVTAEELERLLDERIPSAPAEPMPSTPAGTPPAEDTPQSE